MVEMHQNFEQIAKIISIVIDSMVQPLQELTKTSEYLEGHLKNIMESVLKFHELIQGFEKKFLCFREFREYCLIVSRKNVIKFCHTQTKN